MNVSRIHPERSEPNVDDLEARLADLRDAMYRASRMRNDPEAQKVFLDALFADGDSSTADLAAVVEARDLPSWCRIKQRWVGNRGGGSRS